MEDPRRLPFRRVRSLLWNETAALLNPGERDVVRKSIGAAVIEENEVLFREAVAYEEILQFVDEDMQRQVASHKILDTPARQMLEKEIKILVEHIQATDSCEAQAQQSQSLALGLGDLSPSRSQAVDQGSGPSCSSPPVAAKADHQVSPRKSAKNPLSLHGRCKSTLDYVMSKNAIQEKQKKGNPSLFPPRRSEIFSRGDDHPVLRKAAMDPSLIVRKMAPHLNVSGIDAINDRLRHAFAAEHDALLEDVECLRSYLEDSTDVYSSVKNNPPTINDMKDCGKKLEERWTALKHCQNIQNILAPVPVGGVTTNINPMKTSTASGPEPEVAVPQSRIASQIFPGSKRSIRLPKMQR
ncbi:uncharacterized protein LOC112340592 [Selaginella moellendorffii]|uniref:uncharacterized protein LOC112340592 n=1 Tax=Selaginella moellendorffii TaxID=88036 RepID=UPI000D1C2D2A|nr:uncharacterized protein LOC112340592 [Selaginella moellendorffii]|eukprot:XP_024515062.1 uncharacterized protein LOC112340592 [Selaginella moellendorffii]